MGPLPTTKSGNAYILTIQDLLTKYSLALPLRHAGAIDVADAFMNLYVHSEPQKLSSPIKVRTFSLALCKM